MAQWCRNFCEWSPRCIYASSATCRWSESTLRASRLQLEKILLPRVTNRTSGSKDAWSRCSLCLPFSWCFIWAPGLEIIRRLSFDPPDFSPLCRESSPSPTNANATAPANKCTGFTMIVSLSCWDFCTWDGKSNIQNSFSVSPKERCANITADQEDIDLKLSIHTRCIKTQVSLAQQ